MRKVMKSCRRGGLGALLVFGLAALGAGCDGEANSADEPLGQYVGGAENIETTDVGEPCEVSDDCQSGWCVPTADGAVCTRTCTTSCPDEWSCVPASTNVTDVSYICVPPDEPAEEPAPSDPDTSLPDDEGSVGLSPPSLEDPEEDPLDPGNLPDPTDPADDPTDPVDEPADDPTDPVDEPTDDPTDPVDEPTDDPTDPVDEPTDDPTDPADDPADPVEDPADDDGCDDDDDWSDDDGWSDDDDCDDDDDWSDDGDDDGDDGDDEDDWSDDGDDDGDDEDDWSDDDDAISDEEGGSCPDFELRIYNTGVSAAWVMVDGIDVVRPNAFPTDEPIVVPLEVSPGSNTLEIGGRVAGSPEDVLHLKVVDDTGEVWLHEVIVRKKGKPQMAFFSFEVDEDCPAP
ncbi:MAG: hypothetical protein ACQEXJ_13235 [Myxococcota bacterium]